MIRGCTRGNICANWASNGWSTKEKAGHEPGQIIIKTPTGARHWRKPSAIVLEVAQNSYFFLTLTIITALHTIPAMAKQDSVDFGYTQVPRSEKAQRVRGVFDSVAARYDLMNDLMSGGAHRLWKRFALSQTGLRPGDSALDVAGGSGDLSIGMSAQVGAAGLVVLSDINNAMLARGRDRLIDAGIVGNVRYAQADAECLPFRDAGFHCVTIGFGLRNVTDKPAALGSMRRVLQPGGRLVVLEFSKPVSSTLSSLYDNYSFNLLPRLGQLVAGDADSYRYLAESIRRHPDQETLLAMMRDAGLEDCRYTNLFGGIVAVHTGYRF
jgi:demethylmenaquinone methyltransferase/2-methoxy-6-polyprenyl-1,4-benzoquinol methylase